MFSLLFFLLPEPLVGLIVPPVTHDEEPPPEEIEMGAEEALGRPLRGHPAERVEALTKRIAYLEKMLQSASPETAPAFHRDLEAARKQLSDWQHQNGAQN